jgi:hypothetical protein
VFEKPKLKLDAVSLEKYTGSYQFNGATIELKKENDGLAMYFSPSDKYVLYTAGETDFYSTAEFFAVHFKIVNGKTEGFQLERWGNTQFLKRIN